MVTWKEFFRRTLLASFIGCAYVAGTTTIANAEDVLTIGSPAPALDVEHWVQNGNGKFKPVTEFTKGKVYVVEFWATWCGPCIGSMPHLVEIQNKFADRDVQIVSISNEDLATVEKFLEREYKAVAAKAVKQGDAPAAEETGDTPKTYRDLTSAYCLTTDPDRSSDKSYMEAAGQNGIPCAFIVGKDQKIEWIGHPMAMDDALGKVVDGKWDREVFAEEFKESQQMGLLMAKIMRSARSGKMDEALSTIEEVLASTKSDSIKQRMQMMRVQLFVQAGKSAEAMTALDDLIAAAQGEAQKLQLRSMRIQMLLQDVSNPKLPEVVTQSYAEFKDNPQLINMIAWTLYEKFQDGLRENKPLLKASRAAAEQAAADANDAAKAAILDTAAHLQYLDGDTATALKTQEQAVKLAGDDLKAAIVAFFEELKKADK